MLRDDAGHDDDEGACWAANLHARPSQGGDEEARDDSGVNAGLGLDAGSDTEGHRQRQRDQAYSDAGDEVSREIVPRVATQAQEKFWGPAAQISRAAGLRRDFDGHARHRLVPGHLQRHAATPIRSQ